MGSASDSIAESSSHSPLVDRKACFSGAERANLRHRRIPGVEPDPCGWFFIFLWIFIEIIGVGSLLCDKKTVFAYFLRKISLLRFSSCLESEIAS